MMVGWLVGWLYFFSEIADDNLKDGNYSFS